MFTPFGRAVSGLRAAYQFVRSLVLGRVGVREVVGRIVGAGLSALPREVRAIAVHEADVAAKRAILSRLPISERPPLVATVEGLSGQRDRVHYVFRSGGFIEGKWQEKGMDLVVGVRDRISVEEAEALFRAKYLLEPTDPTVEVESYELSEVRLRPRIT